MLRLLACLMPLMAATASAAPAFPRDAKANGTANSTGVAEDRLLVSGPGYITEIIYDNKGKAFKVAQNHSLPGEGPSWLLWTQDKVYANNENGNTTSLWKRDTATNELKRIDNYNGSAGVVHFEQSAGKTRMLGAAYGQGSIDVWDSTAKDGSLKLIKQVASNDPVGPKPQQGKPHPHQVVRDPYDKFFFVNDLGTDTILVLSAYDDTFNVVNHHRLPSGSGPRHGSFYPKYQEDVSSVGKLVYMVVCEISNQIILYEVVYTGGAMTLFQLQTISTYGDQFPPANRSTAAAGDLLVVPRGNLTDGFADVYVTNRLSGNQTDNISRFTLDMKHGPSLTFQDCVSTGGISPRSIAAPFGNSYIFATNMMSGEVGLAAFRRNHETGKLDDKPEATMKHSEFSGGKEGFGPAFVMPVVWPAGK